MDLAPPINIDRSIIASTNVVALEDDWAVGTTYATSQRVNRDLAGKGRAWASAVDDNVGHDPATDDGTNWVDLGPSLPFQMFGDSATTQSTATDLIDVVLELPATERLNYLWFGNLSGTTLQVTATDATEGVISDRTFSLVADSGVDDWWKYFAYPVERLREFLVSDIPPLYSGLTLEVQILEAGATVGCGAMVLGLGQSLGDTMWGVQLGRRDFSTIADNAFGDRVVVERGYRQTVTATCNLDNSKVDSLMARLAQFRAKPALFVASGDYAAMAIWGTVKSFQTQVPGPALSFCSLELESLTQ